MDYRSGKISNVLVARIDDGEDILSSLEKIVVENEIQVGSVQSIIGGVRDLKFSHFKMDDDGQPKSSFSEIKGPCNFWASGIVMPDEETKKPVFHIHFSAGLFGTETRSCHLIRAIAHFYCDVVILLLDDIDVVKKQFKDLPNIKHAKITEFM